MSWSFVAAVRPRVRRILWVAVAGLAVWAIVVAQRAPARPPLGQTDYVCQYPAQPPGPEPEPLPPPPARPIPADSDYDGLARCLEALRADETLGPSLREADVTVAKVRYWVEVEGDPAWQESAGWAFPLSDEGDSQMPSGLYVSVPSCGAMIVN